MFETENESLSKRLKTVVAVNQNQGHLRKHIFQKHFVVRIGFKEKSFRLQGAL